jgi:AcrR family transcriptional regulator
MKRATKRTYTLRRRAERQAETRQRIVEAAVDLHGTVGPARTTLTMIAERAGVQRHTLYAHFPEERDLFLACSAHSIERNPLPDPEPWRAIEDATQRLRAGLGALHGWYERNAALAAAVLRDAEVHALTREVVGIRIASVIERCAEVLGAGLAPPQVAMLRLAMSFHTWRTLVQDGGLDTAGAVEALARAIEGAARA